MKLVAISPTFVAAYATLTCPKLEPGNSTTIYGNFTTPGKEGFYAARYLFFQAGVVFGDPVETTILVEKEQPTSSSEEEDVTNNARGSNPTIYTSFFDRKKGIPTCCSSVDVQLAPVENEANGSNNEDEEDENDDDGAGDVDDGGDGANGEVANESEAINNDEEAEGSGSGQGDGEYVLVPMPACFIADQPYDETEPVLVKFDKQEIGNAFSSERKEQEKDEVQSNEEASTSNEEAKDVTFYREFEKSAMKEEGLCKLGKLLAKYSEDSGTDGKIKTGNNNVFIGSAEIDARKIAAEIAFEKVGKVRPENTEITFIVRDKFKKFLYINPTGKPFSVPSDKSELVFSDDPEFEETVVVPCDKLVVDRRGALYPVLFPESEIRGKHLTTTPGVFPCAMRFGDLSSFQQQIVTDFFIKTYGKTPLCTFHAANGASSAMKNKERAKSDEQVMNAKHDGGNCKHRVKPFSPVHMKINGGRKWRKQIPVGKGTTERKHGKVHDHSERKKTEDYSKYKFDLNSLEKRLCRLNKACASLATMKGRNEVCPHSVKMNGNRQGAQCAHVNSDDNQQTEGSATDMASGNPVHILPEGLMTGAINAAYSAYNTAKNAFYGPTAHPSMFGEREQLALAMLYEMGFTNFARNIQMLEKHNYEVAEVVEHYCKKLGD